MRPVAAVALLALLVLAGCAGGIPDAGGTATPEPDVRGTPASPPGVDTGGVTDAAALVEAHRRSLVEAGFVLEVERTRRGPGGPNVTTTRRIVAEPGAAGHHRVVTRHLDDGREVRHQRWTDGGDAARRVLENGTPVAHGPYDGATPAALVRTAELRRFLRQPDLAVASVAVGPEGTRYVLQADGAYPGAGGEQRGHLTVRAVVTVEGRVQSLVATATIPTDGGQLRRQAYRYRLVGVGEDAASVGRPSWVDQDQPGGENR